MSFGLTNASTTFEHALNLILAKCKWKIYLLYTDGIFVFSKDIEKHLENADEIITKLGETGITFNLKKGAVS